MTEPPGNTLTLAGSASRSRGGPAHAALHLVFTAEPTGCVPARCSLAGVDAVELGRGEPGGFERPLDAGGRRLRVRVPDPWMSSSHATMTRVFDRWVLADAGSRNGTFRDGARVESAELEDGALIELGRSFFLFRSAVPVEEGEPLVLDARQLAARAPGLATLVPGLARELDRLARVAASEVPILIAGETGTGKELVARAVHALSGRPGPFVPVNCGALPDSLIESELFGHRRGAFSGAIEDRPGLVRSADGGTLFLDEIGDLPAPSQAALLRVLQEREVTPVGATRAVGVDVRFVAATHRDLEAMVADGGFRADLLARVAGYPVVLPPLRERREDLGLIIRTLLGRSAPGREAEIRFHGDAARALLLHAWPLNVRELEKALAAAVVLAGPGVIGAEHLPAAVRAAAQGRRAAAATPPAAATPAADEALPERERALREELVACLRAHGGNISAVARAMGKARMQIQRWIRRFRLDPDSYR